MIRIPDLIPRWTVSPFGHVADPPWVATQVAEALVTAALSRLPDGYRREGDVAVHCSATVETGAVVKGPAMIGARCLVAAGAYLRGGVWLDEDVIVGPGSELKTSFMFRGSKLAHFNFVGDSLLGERVNLEAGSIIANYRNEKTDKAIRLRLDGRVIDTGCDKFGAILGDGVRIGANAVVAPGAVLRPDTLVPRLGLVDQHPEAAPR